VSPPPKFLFPVGSDPLYSGRCAGTWPPLLEVYSSGIQLYGLRSLGILTMAQLLQMITVQYAAAQGWTRLAALASEALLGNHHLIFLALPAVLVSATAGLVVVVLSALQGWTRIASDIGRLVDRRGLLLSLPKYDRRSRSVRRPTC
jgi:hypothetical protein